MPGRTLRGLWKRKWASNSQLPWTAPERMSTPYPTRQNAEPDYDSRRWIIIALIFCGTAINMIDRQTVSVLGSGVVSPNSALGMAPPPRSERCYLLIPSVGSSTISPILLSSSRRHPSARWRRSRFFFSAKQFGSPTNIAQAPTGTNRLNRRTELAP